jgi:tetratricopeptide (TPR) repeat protein
MSLWRNLDWETSFSPESQTRLSAEYVSPATAVDLEINREKTRPYFPNGLNLAPPVPQSGIVYMETFLNVPNPTDAWVYANFAGAGRVWVSGAEVISHADQNYDTGKWMRRVRLSAGTHRVLIKLGVQRGYRDWLEFQVIPDAPTPLSYSSGCLEGRLVEGCFDGQTNGTVAMLGESTKPTAWEPVWISPDAVEKANDASLYLTLLGAHFSGDVEVFDHAWHQLAERRPKFAAIHGLRSTHVQTRWEMPARLRDAASLQSLRDAHGLAPDSGLFAHLLGSRLQDKAKDREVREILQKSFESGVDGTRLRYLSPITVWANYLETQGYDELSEQVWQKALQLAPSDCSVARKIQVLEQSRQIFREPSQITPHHKSCPALREAFVNARKDLAEENLKMSEKYALRFPFQDSTQRRYAEELLKMGRSAEAERVVDDALQRLPDSATLWNWKIDRAYAQKGAGAAIAIINAVMKVHGTQGWLIWKRANISGEIPLLNVIPDGHDAAMKAVRDSESSSLSNDDAYYVVDYAARSYFPDGASLTLTHTVVRVMTKNAIDRYAETNLPGDAYPLQVRTIKKDGTTMVPDDSSGKEALSMPGLAEGDFVEVAYLQYSPASTPKSEREGIKFFFKMKDISTLHSEYTVWGDAGDFVGFHGAPKAEPISREGMTGTRFLAVNNPRPRQEPYTVPIDEFLPWIQNIRSAYTLDDFEVARRAWYERVHESLRVSAALRQQLETWTSGENIRTEEGIRDLFYTVAQWIPDPNSTAFGTEASHAFLTREGSTHLLLKAALDHAGIPAQIFMARSSLASPEVSPTQEMGRYVVPIVRIEVPGVGIRWVSPDGPDATWSALGPIVEGQKAVCITCNASMIETIPVGESLKPFAQSVRVDGDLDEAGNLRGTIEIALPGSAALSFRQGLRSRKDAANRDKLMGSLAANIIDGSTMVSYEVENETNPEQDLRIRITFERPNFARRDGATLVIETRIFHEALAQYYAALPNRTTPMMIGYARKADQSLRLRFPKTPQLLSQSKVEAKGRFGNYQRLARTEGNILVLESTVDVPIQRVQPDAYLAFQKWATQVDESSVLKVAVP